MIQLLCERFGIAGAVREAGLRAFERVRALEYPAQERIQANVLAAFAQEGLGEHDLTGTLGYGYDDAARDRYESLLCRLFGTERALARLSLVSGTHAIVTAIAACVPPGKTLLIATGPPYDTLANALRSAPHNLSSRGIGYREIDMVPAPNQDGVLHDRSIAAVFVQRSRGYAPRPSLSVARCETIFRQIKAQRPDVAILVDNCYGEFVEEREPSHAGADLIIGSCIKNPGGTVAPGGAYVAGRADLVERVAAYHYAPGLGAAVGPTLGFGRAFLQGLFLAPHVVAESLRGLDFSAALFEELGYAVDPRPGDARTDVVQAIRLGSAQQILRFARGLQSVMPVNARFRPEPGAVPGYADSVVMSGGAFVAGATIELSCDAPLREPFDVYLQGGMPAAHTYAGALAAAQGLKEA